MCLPLRDKNLWCCGPRSIEMWLANCAPCQQSSPESIADKDDTAFASTQRCTKYSVRRLNECFLHGKKARPKQSLKAGIFVCWKGSAAVHEIFRAETQRMFSPRQKSSPKTKLESWHLCVLKRVGSGARNIPCGDSTNVFSTAKKLAQNKAWKLASLCVEKGRLFQSADPPTPPPPWNSMNDFFYRQRTRKKKIIASLSCYAWKEHTFV